jgi:hypothetical protein
MANFTGYFHDVDTRETIVLGTISALDMIQAGSAFRANLEGAGLSIYAPSTIEVTREGEPPTLLLHRERYVAERIKQVEPSKISTAVPDPRKESRKAESERLAKMGAASEVVDPVTGLMPSDALNYVDTDVDVEAVG